MKSKHSIFFALSHRNNSNKGRKRGKEREGANENREKRKEPILKTTLRVSFSPHNEPLLADGLISPQTEVSEASGGNDLEVAPIQKILYDCELLDRVADTEWDSTSSRLIFRRSAGLKN
ncbi:unnamed protein product [Cuscuta epithymum]|uniref:Uncharacterized protein n=1 Tax=Cuscuta epithymum TaxID=186058 RepID=A0AAV0C1X8_9ASTE|nr:unnamed protein product [Cuscuta epithymum]